MKRTAKPGGWKSGPKAGGAKPWERREGGTGGGYRADGPQVSHDAKCSECNSFCSVPFKPNGSKPVLCNKCFKKDGAPSDQKRSRAGASFGADRRPSFGEKRPYKQAYKPAGGDYSANRGGGMKSDEFKILDAKLDAILRALS